MTTSTVWTRREFAGRECLCFEPTRPLPHEACVIYLHDHDEDAMQYAECLLPSCEALGLRMVCPQAGPTWWLDVKIPQFHREWDAQRWLAAHLIPEVRTHWNLPERRLAAVGVGMGGQGALTLSYLKPQVVPVVAAIAPAIDYHLLVPEFDPLLTETFGDREWARQHTAILRLHPLNWPVHQFVCADPEDYTWFDSGDRMRMKLHSMGIPCEVDLETSAAGDRRAYVALMAERTMSFVASSLEKERRRVV